MGNPINTLSANLYDNIELYHPNGKLMCFLNKRRLNWYIKKNLAINIGTNKFQLLFEPKGTGENLEVLQPIKNICVISGNGDNLTRHHVVPKQFRQYFRLDYKDKNSFDIVLLTRILHDEYEKHATELKNRLFEDYSVKLKEFYSDFIIARKFYYIMNNINFEKIPHTQQIYIQMKLEGIKEMWNLKNEDFKFTSPYQINNVNKKIVEVIGEELLIILWKYHFIKYCQPKYLPDWWKPNLIKINKKDQNSNIFYKKLNEKELEFLNKYNCL